MSAFGKEEKFKYAFKFGRCALKLFIFVVVDLTLHFSEQKHFFQVST
jgi:hypothetical protein